MLKSVLSQKYYGDITILPELSWSDIAHMFVDRPAAAIKDAIHRGEVATWPSTTLQSCVGLRRAQQTVLCPGVEIALIKSQLQAELTLDEILLGIRDRLLAMSENGATAPSATSQTNGQRNSPVLRSTADLRASILTTSSTDDPNSDVMLDPQVDIRRHLSPSLPSALPSRPTASVDTVTGEHVRQSTPKLTAALLSKRARSFPRLHSARPPLE